MTQHPPLQSAPRSEGRSQDAGTLWYEQTRGQSHVPTSLPDPPSPAESRPAALTRPGAATVQPAKLRRLAELGVVAALAAVLASTGTYAVTRLDNTPSPTAQTSASAPSSAAPVAQADSSAPNWSVTAAAVSPSVVSITVTSTQGSGQGSGVIIDTKGHILTKSARG